MRLGERSTDRRQGRWPVRQRPAASHPGQGTVRAQRPPPRWLSPPRTAPSIYPFLRALTTFLIAAAITATRAAGTRQQLTASARPAAGPGSTSLPVIDLVDFPGWSRRGRSVAAVWRVGGQPLCRERVRSRLAPAVAGDGGE